MPFFGFAADLGELNVTSSLGEPLKAEVELLSVTPEELSTLVAVIASEEAYVAQGIARLGIHNDIRVDLTKNADGLPVLTLYSSQPISDPYLDMLIQVNWASGRILREYAVLLDSPEYKQSISEASLAPISPPSVASNANKDEASGEVNPDTFDGELAKQVGNQTDEQQDKYDTTADTAQLTTVRSDTLISIARKMQVDGVSLDQMLVALFENNKEAFSDGNMNRLKVGKIIKAPSKDSFMAIDAQQAKQSVKVHTANWNEYRRALADTVAKISAGVESEQKQSASGKIVAAEDNATLVKSGSRDVVKLSAGEKDFGKGSKESGQEFDAKISALQEEAIAREKALKESQERTTVLEKQIEDMQKLLALKNQAMTDLQKKVENPTSTAAEIEKMPPIVKTPVEFVLEASFIEGLLDNVDMALLGGTAGVTLLGIGWMFLRNKRRRTLDSFKHGTVTSGDLRANTIFGNTTDNASASDTTFDLPLMNELDTKVFDFSAINLDLGKDEDQAVVGQSLNDLSIEQSVQIAPEHQDIEIKFDLVAAYIDMDDKDGARELLDEVIKEGGPQQRQRAEQLLASLA